jgi:hypothetical protein
MLTASPGATPLVSSRNFFIAAVLLLFLGESVYYTQKVLAHRGAFTRWQEQILAIEEGVDINARFNYPNPPIMAILLFPLAKLPAAPAALAWFYLKVVMTLLSLRWVFQLVAQPGRPFPAWACALTLILSLRPILGDLQHGNVNLFILFLIVASLAALQRRRDFLAGTTLALAIACKVTPALFIPYLAWKRAWKALAGVGVGLILFLWPGVVPGVVLGFEQNQQQLTSWYREMVYPFVVEGKVTSDHPNQSLPGLVARMLTHQPSFSTYDEQGRYTPTEYDNVLSLEPMQARRIVQGCMLLFALMVVVCCRTPLSDRQGWRLGAEFALVVVGMLLFSERTWKHHCVTLILPFAVLCYYLAACRPRPFVAGGLTAVLALAFALMGTTSTNLDDRSAAKYAQVYGAYVWVDLLLVVALATLLRRNEDRGATTRESAGPLPTVPSHTSPAAA